MDSSKKSKRANRRKIKRIEGNANLRPAEPLWKMTTSEQLRVWPSGNNIIYFTRNDSGRYMPKSEISTSGRGISEPPAENTDVWKQYDIPQLGIAEHTKGYYHSRRNENFFDLIIVAKGVLSARFENSKIKLRAGDFILIPNRTLCDSSVENVNTRLYWFHLTDTPFWRQILGDKIRTATAECAGELASLMDAYRAEVFGRNRSVSILQAVARAIVSLLKRQFSLPRIPQNKSDKYMLSLLKRVAETPNQKWESKSQAQIAGMSQPTFNAICEKSCGKSFAAYLSQTRMQNALKLLQKGKLSNAKIAALIGYANAYSFSKAFKKYCGVYPSEI